MSDIIKTQRSLAIKAKFQKEHQFDHLYRLICRQDWIADALETILCNKGSKTAGIDGVTKKVLETDTQKGKCNWCGLYFREKDVLEEDHIIATALGGKNVYDNLQLLHGHCQCDSFLAKVE